MFKPVDDAGRFTDLAPAFVRGLFVKDADPVIEDDLRARGVLLRAERIEHNYPFCWRCGTPLLYYARTSWYVRTTEVKDRLLAVNQSVDWYPEHIKDGRYGNWLENNVDWALVPRALLGHAPADLALRTRPPDRHRIAHRAGRTGGPRPRRRSTRTGPRSTRSRSHARSAAMSPRASPR